MPLPRCIRLFLLGFALFAGISLFSADFAAGFGVFQHEETLVPGWVQSFRTKYFGVDHSAFFLTTPGWVGFLDAYGKLDFPISPFLGLGMAWGLETGTGFFLETHGLFLVGGVMYQQGGYQLSFRVKEWYSSETGFSSWPVLQFSCEFNFNQR
ncbi:MAG TPA: hypothetical protein P5560_03195 [Thermotogota bacterium]|nr:hypothetical protein [Thermotogota bacterium]HRW91935.1 hypothetical protein [Thermotogota bacterium]